MGEIRKDLYIKNCHKLINFIQRENCMRMDVSTDMIDHLNYFSNILSQLIGMGVTIKEENGALLLLSFLLNSCQSLVSTLLVGKDALKMEYAIFCSIR